MTLPVHLVLRGRSGSFNCFCVQCAVLFVAAEELHAGDLQLAGNGHDQPVVIACDAQDHSTVLQHAGAEQPPAAQVLPKAT
jgi:hypothetical protein